MCRNWLENWLENRFETRLGCSFHPHVDPSALPARREAFIFVFVAMYPTRDPTVSAPMPAGDLRRSALALAALADPQRKADAVRALDPARLSLDTEAVLDEPAGYPGRPPRPELVSPRALKRRGMHTPQGRAALLHALAHIEFNAINLALDALWRFAGMPAAFYQDWLRVAQEEALHFSLLNAHLAGLDCRYGDFPAHDGLWEMAQKTAGDVLARMALVPRTLEARGLDASPPMRDGLAQAGDMEAAAILDIILRDEIGHVRIGNHWFRFLCEMRGLDPHQAYRALAERHAAPRLRGPFNYDARRAAGFDEAELAALSDGPGADNDAVADKLADNAADHAAGS